MALGFDAGVSLAPDATSTEDAGFEPDATVPVDDTGVHPDASGPVDLFTNATVGRRCRVGTNDNVIVLSQGIAACNAHAQAIEAPDGSPTVVAVLPETSGQVEVMSTVCLPEGCLQQPVTFTIDEWTGSVGARGRYEFAIPNVGEYAGEFDTGWCEYDEFLGGATALVSDLAINRLSILQGTTAILLDDGVPVQQQNAPVVEGRDAVLRVNVRRSPDFATRDVIAVLTLSVPGQDSVQLEQQKNVSRDSTDGDLTSSFNFDIPADSVVRGTEYKVGLYEIGTCEALGNNTDNAQFPVDGRFTSLNVRSMGETFNVVLVPIRYNADGSGREPDLSPGNVQAYTDALLTEYPIADANVTVRPEPMDWDDPVTSRAGWSAMLSGVQAVRNADRPSPNTYYYGLIEGASGGIGGLAFRPGPNSNSQRVGVGRGPSSPGSADTMLHELGHTTGRAHADCGNPEDPDPNYPHAGAGLGVHGYNIFTRELVDAEIYKDIMSYCNPSWLSDYTYAAIFERIAFVNNAAPLTAWPERTVRVAITTDDAIFWGQTMVVAEPVGRPVTVQFEDATGHVVATATADEAIVADDGGIFYYVPPRPSPNAVAVRLPDGRALAW